MAKVTKAQVRARKKEMRARKREQRIHEKATWVIKGMWTELDNRHARAEGWHIRPRWGLSWNPAYSLYDFAIFNYSNKRANQEAAVTYVKMMADRGSALHVRAIAAIIASQLMGDDK